MGLFTRQTPREIANPRFGTGRWWSPGSWRGLGPGRWRAPTGVVYDTSCWAQDPVALTETEALRVTALWRAGNLIADSLAQVPLEAFSVGSWTANALSENVTAKFVGTPGILAKPEADFGRIATIHRLVWSLLLHGDIFALVDRTMSADPETVDMLWVLDPNRMTVERDEMGYKHYKYLAGSETYLDLPVDRVLHTPWVSVPGSDVGVGALEAFGDSSLRIARALSYFMGSAIVEGGLPSAVITVNTPNLTDDMARAYAEAWQRKTGGRKVPVVVNGQVTVQPISADATLTMQTASMWNTIALEISNITGVPAAYLNAAIPGSSLEYNNLESRQRDLVAAIRPFAVRLEEVFTGCLPRTQRALFSLDTLARGETKTRYEAYKVAVEAGFLTIDEVRRMENLPSLEDVGAPQITAGGGSNVTPFPASAPPRREPNILAANSSTNNAAVGP